MGRSVSNPQQLGMTPERALRNLVALCQEGATVRSPYSYPEIEHALRVIAQIDGKKEWLDANDDTLAERATGRAYEDVTGNKNDPDFSLPWTLKGSMI